MSKGSIVIGLQRLLLCVRNDDDNEGAYNPKLYTTNWSQVKNCLPKPHMYWSNCKTNFDLYHLPKTHVKPQKFF